VWVVADADGLADLRMPGPSDEVHVPTDRPGKLNPHIVCPRSVSNGQHSRVHHRSARDQRDALVDLDRADDKERQRRDRASRRGDRTQPSRPDSGRSGRAGTGNRGCAHVLRITVDRNSNQCGRPTPSVSRNDHGVLTWKHRPADLRELSINVRGCSSMYALVVTSSSLATGTSRLQVPRAPHRSSSPRP
jgi:hypothetical protein